MTKIAWVFCFFLSGGSASLLNPTFGMSVGNVASKSSSTVAKTSTALSEAPAVDLYGGITNPLFSGNAGACPTSWTCNGSPDPGFASYSPTAVQYPGGSPFTTSASAPTVYGGSGIIRQLTSLTWTGGASYTLNLWVGLPLTEPDGTTPVENWPQSPNGVVRVYLTMGSGFGEVAAFDIPSPAPGTFAANPISFTLPANSGAVGQQIGVMIFVSAPSLFSANFAMSPVASLPSVRTK